MKCYGFTFCSELNGTRRQTKCVLAQSSVRFESGSKDHLPLRAFENDKNWFYSRVILNSLDINLPLQVHEGQSTVPKKEGDWYITHNS